MGALALMLVFEGVLPFISPTAWRQNPMLPRPRPKSNPAAPGSPQVLLAGHDDDRLALQLRAAREPRDHDVEGEKHKVQQDRR